MHVPKLYHHAYDDEVSAFIRANSFGIVLTGEGGRITGTHIPLELTMDGTELQGHVSRANPQWKNFKAGQEVLAIFNGPHTYVSSSWYDHENVPTWNYIAIHVYGTIRIIEGEELYLALKNLVDKYESSQKNPVSIEKMSQDYVLKHIEGLVGFSIRVTEVQAAYKLSQNRDAKNYQAVVDALGAQADPQAIMVAEEMKKLRNKKSTI
jgi:transcriptional regulator